MSKVRPVAARLHRHAATEMGSPPASDDDDDDDDEGEGDGGDEGEAGPSGTN